MPAKSSGVSPRELRGLMSAPNAIRAFTHSLSTPCCSSTHEMQRIFLRQISKDTSKINVHMYVLEGLGFDPQLGPEFSGL